MLTALDELAARHPRARGGLAVLIDELGKILEHAAHDGADIHFFQELAERASRSGGRLLVVGILHQAFDEYAHRLSRGTRDEWAKIQGRYVDLPVNPSGFDQLDLLARAIRVRPGGGGGVGDAGGREGDAGGRDESGARGDDEGGDGGGAGGGGRDSQRPASTATRSGAGTRDSTTGGRPSELAAKTADLMRGAKPPALAATLARCWPLHPITACLLGPLSRRRFGQNQRSLFGFLNSAEPGGFRDFLLTAQEGELYTPDRLWDYLRINLEPSILASPDGHRWALGADALARCEAASSSDLEPRLLKTIALSGLLQDRSRLPASNKLLEVALADTGRGEISRALKWLRSRSLIVYRKFADAWSVFEGSDFDSDAAVEKALRGVSNQDAEATAVATLARVARLRPIVAKRHYHDTGALRWFEFVVVGAADLENAVAAWQPRHEASGCFVLALSDHNDRGADVADGRHDQDASTAEARHHRGAGAAHGRHDRGADAAGARYDHGADAAYAGHDQGADTTEARRDPGTGTGTCEGDAHHGRGADAADVPQSTVSTARDRAIVVGFAPSARTVGALALELAALEQVRDGHPELQGDRVARAELAARLAVTREGLDIELGMAIEQALWHVDGDAPAQLNGAELNSLASDLADDLYRSAPVLRNELLARSRPTSSAVAARNALLRRMTLNETDERLGLTAYPAEAGLYESLLYATGLHRRTARGWRFARPRGAVGKKDDRGRLARGSASRGGGTTHKRAAGDKNDPWCLAPLWNAAVDELRKRADRPVPVAELYALWRKPPYGIKEGLLPVLAVAFLLAERASLAYYRDGLFLAELSELDIDWLNSDPANIQVRWMKLSGVSRRLLSELAAIVRDLDRGNELVCLDPIDVARGLVALHDTLPPWVGRTRRLSANALRLRELLKHANDPNKLLFDDLPAVSGAVDAPDTRNTVDDARATHIAEWVRHGLVELQGAYPGMLARLRELLLEELEVPALSLAVLDELRSRAANIRELGGDYRIEAFIVRLASFDGSDAAMEGLAGMAANKPVHNWTDSDVDKAMVELADMARRFVRAEAYAHVKGRTPKRQSMAMIVGLDGRNATLRGEFAVAEADRGSVESLVNQLETTLQGSREARRDIVLAALAKVSSRYLASGESPGAS